MDHAAKRHILTAGRDLARATGIEIGAREAPLVTRDMGPIRYADYADTATLRATLAHPELDLTQLVDVDLVTGGGRLSPLVAERVDYILASHVIEHVPDLIGWLADMHACLASSGTLGLAIPDKRFVFDRWRTESGIAEAVEAWLEGFTRPSLRQVFDSCWMATDISVADAWRAPPGDVPQATEDRLLPALGLVEDIKRAPRYNDAHCWAFTPLSFLRLLRHIGRLGALPFVLHEFHPTAPGGYEFLVVLRRQDPIDIAAILGSLETARARTEASPGEVAWRALDPLSRLATLEAENAALRNDLQTMRNATLWRATAPLRALIDRLR